MSSKYETITESLVDHLEQVDPEDFERPWAGGAGRPVNPTSGTTYHGVNTVNLWAAAHVKNYSSHEWYTYRQAQEAGGHVRKGESGEKICWFQIVEKDPDEEGEGDDEPETFPVLKLWTVFNVDQLEGVEPADQEDYDPLPEDARHKEAEHFIAGTGAQIEHEENARAYYDVADDRINLPDFERFEAPEFYYSTALHELGHWTGPPDRLDREELFSRFGDGSYAAEELVAELTASFLTSDLGLPLEYDRPAAYLKNWLEVMKADPYAIFTAARAAEDAAEFLHDYQA